ncbi:putative reverse transcriptase domain-containing protein [Tanacetum coccineum]
MEKLFQVLGCPDNFKTRLAVFKLEGDALSWWKAHLRTQVGGDAFADTDVGYCRSTQHKVKDGPKEAESRAAKTFSYQEYVNCPLRFDDRIRPANLLPIHSSTLCDLGMDWLASHRATIDCYAKTVIFGNVRQPEFVYHGSSPLKSVKLISAMKARTLISHGCQVPLMFVSQMNFPDFRRLREIEFGIELIPSAEPILKAPYRMAPVELKEFLKELTGDDASLRIYQRFRLSPNGRTTTVRKENFWGLLAITNVLLRVSPDSFTSYPLMRKVKVCVTDDVREFEECETEIGVCSILALPSERLECFSYVMRVSGGYWRVMRIESNLHANRSKIAKGRRKDMMRLVVVDRLTQVCSFLTYSEETRKGYRKLRELDLSSDKHFMLKPMSDPEDHSTLEIMLRLHASIKAAPFELLYGRKCRAPICWDEVGERLIEGPELIEITNEKVVVLREA